MAPTCIYLFEWQNLHTAVETIGIAPAHKFLHDASQKSHIHDPMLQQHRQNHDLELRPYQNELPVWYFLTAHLARHDVLKALLKLDRDPLLTQATAPGLTAHDTADCQISWVFTERTENFEHENERVAL
jgi:hypothetical protein